MKRDGFLIQEISDYQNILLAFYKASKSKRNRPDVIQFEQTLESSIQSLIEHVKMGEMPPGSYKEFRIFDPKERTISVAPFAHRVLHHAVMNVCSRKFDNQQVFHSYACRTGKGSLAAIEYVQKNIKRNTAYLKLDVRKYFASIDHEILLAQMERLFKDETFLKLLRGIVKFDIHDCAKGLPIGNLTSQFFANHYLSFFDRWLKSEMKVRYYARYMDDMLLFNITSEEAKFLRNSCNKFLNEKLKLELKIEQINWVDKGIPFLGYRLHKNMIRLNPRSKQRFLKTWRKLDGMLMNGEISDSLYRRRIESLFVFAERAEIDLLKRKYFDQGNSL